MVFLGTLWSSIKDVKAPFLFYVEHGIGLQAMQVNWASSSEEGMSHVFSRVVARTWGSFSSYNGDGPSTLVFVQLRQDS